MRLTNTRPTSRASWPSLASQTLALVVLSVGLMGVAKRKHHPAPAPASTPIPSPAAAEQPTPAPQQMQAPATPARFREFGGHSGNVLALIADGDALEELNTAGLRVPNKGPGVFPFQWPAVWPVKKPQTGVSLIFLTPFTAKVNGRIGPYQLGTWPNETAVGPPTAAEQYALHRVAYGIPKGFVPVTRDTINMRVSEHFKVGDFLSHGQEAVWPKYEVLDLRLVDKLELMIDELKASGQPVRSLHVMSGFRTPSYNAQDVGPGGRSAISRHMYGDAADVYPDDDGDDILDDLNHDGRVDMADNKIVADAAEAVERKYPDLIGGIGMYKATGVHGPFVHVDVRGKRARW